LTISLRDDSDDDLGDTYKATGRFSTIRKSRTSVSLTLILQVPGERPLVVPGLTMYSTPGLAGGKLEILSRVMGTSDRFRRI
jgi:hypothetical protein